MSLLLPRLIGHRGASSSAPENTRSGFIRAAALGAGWVELDVQLSRDGIPVVFHDDRLDRTTDGQGRLVEKSWLELSKLDAGSWFAPEFAGERLLTLAEALAVIGEQGLGVNIEIKAEDSRAGETARIALAEAQRVWPEERTPPLVSSFSRVGLAEARRAAPHWPRGLVTDVWLDDWREAVRELECVSLHVYWRQLTARRVAALRQAGLQVLSYTVNRAASARRLWKMGIASVFTDYPERLLKMTEAHL